MESKQTPEKMAAFCAALATTGNVRKACEAVDCSPTIIYRWRREDPEFAAAWDEAKAHAADFVLEAEAVRRATEGVSEPVYYLGNKVGTVQKYSDTLLIFLLKGANPEKYRDTHKIDMNARVSLSDMSEEEIRQELASLTSAGVVGFAVPSLDDESADDLI